MDVKSNSLVQTQPLTSVARPASTRDEALALAKQQFIYCSDIVHQGVGSVEALAATLFGATVWYFWWD
ncbi:MAG: hypothetical protein V7638_1894 [Acidobacteriota bacterium]|jgi:hypothetical protein